MSVMFNAFVKPLKNATKKSSFFIMFNKHMTSFTVLLKDFISSLVIETISQLKPISHPLCNLTLINIRFIKKN